MHTTIRFSALDSFRGIFALSVVVYHMHIAGSFTELPLFRNADRFVEFFFVLSGFVITHSYGYRPLNLRSFVISRTFRLLPLHLFMLLVFIVLELGKLLASLKGINFTSAPFTAVTAPAEILPNALLVQAWTPYTQYLSFNYPSWSISIEYYTYLLFALVVITFQSHRVAAWLAVTTIMMFASYHEITSPTEAAIRGVSCFFAGNCTYVLARSLRKFHPPSRLAITTLEFIAVIATVQAITSNYEHKSLICSLTFCIVILIFSYDRGWISSFLNIRPLRALGLISYSTYMTHAAILFVFTSICIIFEKFSGEQVTFLVGTTRHLNTGSLLLNNIIALSILAVVLAVSSLTHRLIEARGQMLGKGLMVRQKRSQLPQSSAQSKTTE